MLNVNDKVRLVTATGNVHLTTVTTIVNRGKYNEINFANSFHAFDDQATITQDRDGRVLVQL